MVAKRFVLVALVLDAFVAKSEAKVFCALKVLAVVVLKAVVKMPVEELYARGYTAESEVEEILLLKLAKSLEVRRPRALSDTLGKL